MSVFSTFELNELEELLKTGISPDGTKEELTVSVYYITRLGFELLYHDDITPSVHLLIKYGADINFKHILSGCPLFFMCAWRGLKKQVKFLFDLNVDIPQFWLDNLSYDNFHMYLYVLQLIKERTLCVLLQPKYINRTAHGACIRVLPVELFHMLSDFL